MQFKAVLFLIASLVSSSAFAQDFWTNRQQVFRAADLLQQEVERFDESLHEVNAPADLIELVHHFEETVGEFAELVRFAPYQEAEHEMAHIRQDVGLIRDKIAQYGWVLNYQTVNTEWRHVRSTYRNLDHQMFIGRGGVVSPEVLDSIDADLQEVLDAHAE